MSWSYSPRIRCLNYVVASTVQNNAIFESAVLYDPLRGYKHVPGIQIDGAVAAGVVELE